MTPARLSLAFIVVAALGTVVVGACSGSDERAAWPDAGDVRPAEPRPATSASSGAKKPAGRPGRSWQDEETIAGLAASCSWKAECLAEIQEGATKSTEILEGVSKACQPFVPLACSLVPLQSCAPDYCAQVDYHCYPECNRVCGQCTDACTTSCDTCKATCKDDACRLRCARGCAGCHDRCLKELDHCATAGCAAESADCFEGKAAAWEATDCAKVCPSVTACVDRCPRDVNVMEYAHFAGACPTSCFERLGKGCPSTFADVCKGGDAGGFFHSWYDERKKGK